MHVFDPRTQISDSNLDGAEHGTQQPDGHEGTIAQKTDEANYFSFSLKSCSM